MNAPENEDQVEFIERIHFMIRQSMEPYPADLQHRDTPQDRLGTFVFGLFPELEGAGGLPQCSLKPKGSDVDLIDKHLHDTWPDYDDDDVHVRTFLTTIHSALELADKAVRQGMDLHATLLFLAATILNIIEDGYELRFQHFDDDTYLGAGDDIAPGLRHAFFASAGVVPPPPGVREAVETLAASTTQTVPATVPADVSAAGDFTAKAHVSVVYRIGFGTGSPQDFTSETVTEGSGVHVARSMVEKMLYPVLSWLNGDGEKVIHRLYLSGGPCVAHLLVKVTIGEGGPTCSESEIWESVRTSTSANRPDDLRAAVKASATAAQNEISNRLGLMKADASEGAPYRSPAR